MGFRTSVTSWLFQIIKIVFNTENFQHKKYRTQASIFLTKISISNKINVIENWHKNAVKMGGGNDFVLKKKIKKNMPIQIKIWQISHYKCQSYVTDTRTKNVFKVWELSK